MALSMINDRDKAVRWGIARRHDLPDDAIKTLAQDECYKVRWQIACKPNLKPDVISILSQDKEKLVRDRLNISRRGLIPGLPIIEPEWPD